MPIQYTCVMYFSKELSWMQCPLDQGKEPGSSGSSRLWWHHPRCLSAGRGSWMDTRRHLVPQGWWMMVMLKLEVHLQHLRLDLLRLVHRICSMPSSRRTWNWYRGRGQAWRPWLGFWKHLGMMEWLLSIQRQLLCFFCFVWMKSLAETNYRTNPNKNFQRVLQVPLSSFHLFAEATFGHWPSIQTGSSRRWVVVGGDGVGVELVTVWSKICWVFHHRDVADCSHLLPYFGLNLELRFRLKFPDMMLLISCFRYWLLGYRDTHFQVSSPARKSIKTWSHIYIYVYIGYNRHNRSDVLLTAV